jgi:mannitol-1-phosphate 5-dehydrogenase
MKAVVFGTGKVATAVAGQVFRSSGLDVVFVGRNRAVVDQLNRAGGYVVRTFGPGRSHDHEVGGIHALMSADYTQVASEVAGADIVATGVGGGNLLSIAPLIAAGLSASSRRTNILVFDNLAGAGDCLSHFTAHCLDGASNLHGHAVSGALAMRSVTRVEGDASRTEPLVFVADETETIYVDGTTLRPPLPLIEGMVITDCFEALMQRKLYTFSAGRATATYLGYLKGYQFVHAAMQDRDIRAAVLAAMRQGQSALTARYGADIAGDEEDLREILLRFDNAGLYDRIDGGPQRRLAYHDLLLPSARPSPRQLRRTW